MDVKLIRSKRRKKTISCKIVDGKLLIYVPMELTQKQEKEYIEKIIKRIQEKRRREILNRDENLFKRAQYLNKKYFNGKLKIQTVEYVTNQSTIFGSCSVNSGIIRISDRIADMPKWVRDYVILHELAHLLYPNHSKKFWEKVNQFKYAERARGYLMACGIQEPKECFPD
jgi:hypothetical protein